MVQEAKEDLAGIPESEEDMKEMQEAEEKKELREEVEEAREMINLKKIEAALFISGRWLGLQDLIMLTDLNPILLRELMEKLAGKYHENSAIEILKKEDLWKMDVKPEYVNMINKMATGNSEFTKAEQETLAVIAYKQPVKQSIIIKIRGNKAYDHVKKFIELGLIKAKKLGHTKELNLSEEFHDYFHIGNPQIPGNAENSKTGGFLDIEGKITKK